MYTQVSANEDGPARRAGSRPLCHEQRRTVIDAKCGQLATAVGQTMLTTLATVEVPRRICLRVPADFGTKFWFVTDGQTDT